MPAEFQTEICEFLHNRIIELVPHGIHKIWFLLNGDDDFTLARALSYSSQTYSELLDFGGLLINGRLRKITDIQSAIGIRLGTNSVNKNINGQRKKQLWVRFEADIWRRAIQGLTTLMIVIVGSHEPIRSIQNL
jgi:hypothetical protein